MNLNLTAEQKQIYDFLRPYKDSYVSVNEISRRLGTHRQCGIDRAWARPILRRMEMEGYVESNPFGEYKVIMNEEEETSFREAVKQPGADLGDTAIFFKAD